MKTMLAAIEEGDLQNVVDLISNGFEVNTKLRLDDYSNQEFSAIELCRDSKIALLLIQKGANLTPNIRLRLFRLAENEKNDELMDLLFRQGVARDVHSESGSTALHIAKDESSIKRLVSEEANLEAKLTERGYTPLSLALYDQDDLKKFMLLIDLGADVTAEDCQNRSIISNLIYRDFDIELIRKMLTPDFPFDKKYKDGNTILHMAFQRGNFELIEFLLTFPIDVNHENHDQKTAIELLDRYNFGRQSNKEKIDYWSNVIIDLLSKMKKKQLTNSVDLLKIAVSLNSIRLLNSLISFGLHYTREEFSQAIISFNNVDDISVLEWLLGKGADCNYKYESGLTVLQIFCCNQLYKGIKKLIESGAKHCADNEGVFPIDNLWENRQTDISLEKIECSISIAKLEEFGDYYHTNGKNLWYHLTYENSALHAWEFIQYLLRKDISIPQYYYDCLIATAVARGDKESINILFKKDKQNMVSIASSVAENFDLGLLCYVKTLGFDLNKKENFKCFLLPKKMNFISLVIFIIINTKESYKLNKGLIFLEAILNDNRKFEIRIIENLFLNIFSYACSYGWLNVFKILVLSPFNCSHNLKIINKSIDFASSEELFPIQVAVECKQFDIVKELISRGAKLDVVDKKNRTLLHMAVENPDVNMVKLLVENNIDINALMLHTSLFYPIELSATSLALLSPLKKTDQKIPVNLEILEFLLNRDANTNKNDLMLAIHNFFPINIIEYLLKKIRLEDVAQLKPMHLAAKKNRVDVVDLLLKNGREKLIGLLDNYGRNALYSAIEAGSIECYQLLVEAGERVDVVSYDETNLTLFALYHGQSQRFGLLLPSDFDQAEFDKVVSFLKTFSEFKEQRAEERWHINEYSYKLLLLLRSKNAVEKYINKFKDNESGQPIHNLCQFLIPTSPWDCNSWRNLAIENGPELVKYFHRAPKIDSLLGHSPKNLEETVRVAATITYNREQENRSLAKLFSKYLIPESGFNRVLDQMPEKVEDKIPDIFIDGSVLGEPEYYLKKLSSDDLKGFILGALSACCQSVGSAGEVCAWYGMKSPNAGFYVIIERSNQEKINSLKNLLQKAVESSTPDEFIQSFNRDKSQKEKYKRIFQKKVDKLCVGVNDPLLLTSLKEDLNSEIENLEEEKIIAQSLVWRGRNGGFVFDSWERRFPQYDKLCKLFYSKASHELISQHGFNRVLIGASGQTPSDIKFQKTNEPEYPIDYYDYRDSAEQLLINTRESCEEQLTNEGTSYTP